MAIAAVGSAGGLLEARQGGIAQAAASPRDLQAAFRQVYPTGRDHVVREGQQLDVVFTPKILHRLDAHTWALISEGRTPNEDCHMCQGAFSIAYFIDGKVAGEPFVGSGSMGGLGVAPGLSVTTRLGPTPLLMVRNAFSNQGETEVWVDLIRLGPTLADVGAVAETVALAFDNAGSADDCGITGRIVPKGKAGDFAVRYRGSFRGEVVYHFRDGRYVATPEPPALYERCPER